MSRRYRNAVGELAPNLVLPGHYQKHLRDRLADIEDATSLQNVEHTRSRAVGVVEGLELAKALTGDVVERLYLLIEDAATARGIELEQEGGR